MITDIIAGLISGFVGSMGLGGGGILIIYLTLIRNIPQFKAQGINLIFFIPIATLALVLHTRNRLIDWRFAIKYIICGIFGLVVGYFLLNIINETLISKIFSAILIFVGSKELFSKDNK